MFPFAIFIHTDLQTHHNISDFHIFDSIGVVFSILEVQNSRVSFDI